jgi:predicted RNase H-related nuclease YkuK (DUF458 family)
MYFRIIDIKKNKMYSKELDIDVLREYVQAQGPNTKIYFGADSERVNVAGTWMVDYLLVVVVHIDGCHGAKVFGEIQRDRDYDRKLARPKMRLMTEVMKIAELYLKCADFIEDYHVELHLDLNPLEIHGSSCAVQEAIGYIKGVCNISPRIKPDSWAASICADRLKSVIDYQNASEKKTLAA